MSGIHDFTAKSLAGEDIPLKRFEGQVLLIVNTALSLIHISEPTRPY